MVRERRGKEAGTKGTGASLQAPFTVRKFRMVSHALCGVQSYVESDSEALAAQHVWRNSLHISPRLGGLDPSEGSDFIPPTCGRVAPQSNGASGLTVDRSLPACCARPVRRPADMQAACASSPCVAAVGAAPDDTGLARRASRSLLPLLTPCTGCGAMHSWATAGSGRSDSQEQRYRDRKCLIKFMIEILDQSRSLLHEGIHGRRNQVADRHRFDRCERNRQQSATIATARRGCGRELRDQPECLARVRHACPSRGFSAGVRTLGWVKSSLRHRHRAGSGRATVRLPAPAEWHRLRPAPCRIYVESNPPKMLHGKGLAARLHITHVMWSST